MNAFTSITGKTQSLIDAAFTARGLIPQTFTCACCGDDLDRDEHMRDRFKPGHEEAVIAAFGPMVCFTCADDFEAPQTPSQYRNEDEAYDLKAEEDAA